MSNSPKTVSSNNDTKKVADDIKHLDLSNRSGSPKKAESPQHRFWDTQPVTKSSCDFDFRGNQNQKRTDRRQKRLSEHSAEAVQAPEQILLGHVRHLERRRGFRSKSQR
ncbi:hypothetical protein MHBO_003198 [Bonamia ostreae]|uniref:Uncharacterized protein n=1 Tax=Bonamia ostreae TaxID=126728 RepID=A0ABV2APR9_9EUKA